MKRKMLTQAAKTAALAFGALLSLTAAVDAAAPDAALANLKGVKTVPGEIWKQSVSMSAEGFSMPATHTEVCVPKSAGQENLYKGDKNCSVYDVKNVGNTFTAKMRCAGDNPMEGTIQSTQEGNRTRGEMTMRTLGKGGKAGDSMSMKYDSTRTGQACEAKDYSNAELPQAVAAPKGADLEPFCRQKLAEVQKDPGSAGSFASLYVGAGASCAKSPTAKAFCSTAQSHAGFLALDISERKMSSIEGVGKEAGPDNVLVQPLSATLKGCGAAKNAAEVDALRAKLKGSAQAQDANEFLIYYGGDEEFAQAREVGKRECSGSAYTSAKNPKYAGYCNSLGLALALNNRKGAIAIIDGSCSGDCGRYGIEGTAAGNSRGSNGGSTNAANQGASQPGQQGAAPAGAKDVSKEAAKEAAKEAVDKGKRLLRGLLGGG